MTASATGPQGYIPEFNSLRAAAAFAVMVCHFGLFNDIPVASYVGARMGYVGVDLFFVMSSFLITGILLHYRSLDQPTSVTIRRFYARRALRILPLYFAALGLALLMHENVREQVWWFVTYTVNIGKAIDPMTNWRPINHFWTLAVEEQYYILWPIVVLLVRRRTLIFLCGLGVAVSLATRCVLVAIGANRDAVTQLTLSCLDPLALGAICAILMTIPSPERFERCYRYALWIGALTTCSLLLFADSTTMDLVSRTSNSVLFAGLIATVALRSGSTATAFLRYRPITYLGTISYGLYVWHLPLLRLIQRIEFQLPGFGLPGVERLLNFAFFVAISIAVSAASWHFFEAPLNGLKRYFPYRAERQARAAGCKASSAYGACD